MTTKKPVSNKKIEMEFRDTLSSLFCHKGQMLQHEVVSFNRADRPAHFAHNYVRDKWEMESRHNLYFNGKLVAKTTAIPKTLTIVPSVAAAQGIKILERVMDYYFIDVQVKREKPAKKKTVSARSATPTDLHIPSITEFTTNISSGITFDEATFETILNTIPF